MICRVCHNSELLSFLQLGPQPLANAFLKKEQLNEPEIFYPLDLCFCNKCNFVQLGYVVEPKVLFNNYLYFSSNSEAAQRHYAELAHEAAGLIEKKGFVVEIASNDGILLKNFKDYKDIKALGIEPAANVAAVAQKNGIETVVDFFCERSAKEICLRYGRADVIIGTNVLAHIPDLDNLAKGIDTLLSDNGIVIFESPYLVDFITKLEFDTVYHEHCSYLSIRPLDYFFNRYGMEIYDIKRTAIHGGSIRIFVKRKNDRSKKVSEKVGKMKELEVITGLDKFQTYEKFAENVIKLRKQLLSLLLGLKVKGDRIIGYGAAAKATVLINYAGIGPEILDFIIDKSSYKQDFYMPGKHIPIVSPDRISMSKAGYMLILAWNFADEIMKEQSEFAKKGGKFIIPVPEPTVL